jgi:hypothetical protein
MHRHVPRDTLERPDQTVIDLCRAKVAREDIPARYTGICW